MNQKNGKKWNFRLKVIFSEFTKSSNQQIASQFPIGNGIKNLIPFSNHKMDHKLCAKSHYILHRMPINFQSQSDRFTTLEL